MSTKDTPTTTPLADAYVAACRSQNNLLVARWKWLRSDEERKYTFTTEWLWRPAPDTGSRLWHGRHPGQRCRPSELKEKLRAWVDTLGIALPSCNYWWVRARAYPMDPYHGRRVVRRVSYPSDVVCLFKYYPVELPCTSHAGHEWRVVPESEYRGRRSAVCTVCGLRTCYYESAEPAPSPETPNP